MFIYMSIHVSTNDQTSYLEMSQIREAMSS